MKTQIHRSMKWLILFFLIPHIFYNISYSQVTADAKIVEFNADHGAQIGDFNTYVGTDYRPSVELKENGHETFGRLQHPLCGEWHFTKAAYHGLQGYLFGCAGDPHNEETRRSEQMIIKEWAAGNTNDASDGIRYFSLAFKLLLPHRPDEGKGFIAQLHQGGSGPPPFYIAWVYDTTEHAYFIEMSTYSDLIRSDETYDYNFTNMTSDEIDRNKYLKVENEKWMHMLVSIDPGPTAPLRSGRSSIAPGDNGQIKAWIMDLQSGSWLEAGQYDGRIGFWYEGKEHETGATYRNDKECRYQWKVGIYRNEVDPITYYFDNIKYADRWYRITNNYLIGYHRNVLSYSFDNESSLVVNDRSFEKNAHRSVDYDNDGKLKGTTFYVNSDIKGKALRLLGSGYVHIENDLQDFDFGNYQSVSLWFRTTNSSEINRGLFTVDNFGGKWKSLIYMSDELIAYGVRHPDGTYSKANLTTQNGQYNDGNWHHIVGTFNRWAEDGQRIKLYLDGQLAFSLEGLDKPIARGEAFATVGRCFSDNYFIGDVDEVNVFNYELNAEQIFDLYNNP